MRFDLQKYIDMARIAETPAEMRAHLDVARDHIFNPQVYAMVIDWYADPSPSRFDRRRIR